MKQTRIQQQGTRRPAPQPDDRRSPSGKITWKN